MNYIHTVLLAIIVGTLSFSASAEEPVDLRDKKGIIDPKDLKQHDPKKRSLKIKEPPPLSPSPVESGVPSFEVDKGGIDDSYQPIKSQ